MNLEFYTLKKESENVNFTVKKRRKKALKIVRFLALNLDAIHDTVHEMARDEARHGKAFEGLLKRYFG